MENKIKHSKKSLWLAFMAAIIGTVLGLFLGSHVNLEEHINTVARALVIIAAIGVLCMFIYLMWCLSKSTDDNKYI